MDRPSGLRRPALEADLAATEEAVGRLTNAIAEGGELNPLIEALRTQEDRRQEIFARLTALETPPQEPKAVRPQLERYLDDWRGLLRSNVPQGQQALRRLINGRITFTPRDNYYEFKEIGTVEPMIGGLVHKSVPPTGHDSLWRVELARWFPAAA